MENSSNINMYSSLRGTKQSLAPLSILPFGEMPQAEGLEGLGVRSSYNSRNSQRLFLLLFSIFIFQFSITNAQPYFNRLYTNNAFGSIYVAASTQGNKGGFMTVAMVTDSITNAQGMRVSRFNSEGILQNSGFYNLPDYPARELYVSKGAMCTVTNNCFAIAGIIGKLGVAQTGFLALSDSNGKVYKFVDVLKSCPIADSFMYTCDVQFDGRNIIVLSHIQCSNVPISLVQMINKYDTALNLLWSRTYSEGRYDIRASYSLYVDSSGYVSAGLNQQYQYESKGFKSEAYVFRTDTAGIVQWRWNSPTMMSAATHIVRTADGGYVFPTMGNVYDRDSAHPTWNAYWYAQELLVKLRSDGTLEWQKLYDPHYFPNLGQSSIRLLATADSGFFSVRLYADSPRTIDKTTFADLHKYSSNGDRLFRHKFQVPTDTPMKGYSMVNDIIRCADKSILMAGYYDNRLATAQAPEQRGWLLKVDSNGCMGDTDPQCDPLSIPRLPSLAEEGFKIYPNPSSGQFTIAFPPSNGGAGGGLIIYDITGRKLIQQELKEAETKLDMSQYASGVYWYIIRQGDKTISNGKLIKQ